MDIVFTPNDLLNLQQIDDSTQFSEGEKRDKVEKKYSKNPVVSEKLSQKCTARDDVDFKIILEKDDKKKSQKQISDANNENIRKRYHLRERRNVIEHRESPSITPREKIRPSRISKLKKTNVVRPTFIPDDRSQQITNICKIISSINNICRKRRKNSRNQTIDTQKIEEKEAGLRNQKIDEKEARSRPQNTQTIDEKEATTLLIIFDTFYEF